MHWSERHGLKLTPITHTVAAPLVDGKRVVGVHLQIVHRNKNQHITRKTVSFSGAERCVIKEMRDV